MSRLGVIGTEHFLVTGANGDIANAIGRALRSGFPGAKVSGVDLGDRWPGRCVFSEMHTLPHADDPAYVDVLQKLAVETDVTCIIPCTEPELNKLVSEWDRAREFPLLINQPEVIRIGLDKLRTNRWLSSLGLKTPVTSLLEDALDKDLPLFVKPRIGSGSRNLEIVRSVNHLAVCKEEKYEAGMVAQELLEPNLGEYTCAIFKHNDNVRTLIMRRWLSGGLTSRLIVKSIPAIEETLFTIAEGLPGTAVINVQLRLTANGPKVFEINPRLSSTVMMRHKIGFTDLVWWVGAINGENPPPFTPPNEYRVYRTYDEVVVSPEDVGA